MQGCRVWRQNSPQPVIIVQPLSAKKETLWLLLLCGCVVAMMAIRFQMLKSSENNIHLKPYQKRDDLLTDEQRTLYRTLHASVAEIIELRSQEGWWPEAELLKQENIPPFAKSFLPKKLQGYAWLGYDGGSWIDYLGQDQQNTITFILRLIDLHAGYHPHPHPGIDYDPELSVAVQIWYFPASARSYPGEKLPESGWIWLVQKDDPMLKNVQSFDN